MKIADIGAGTGTWLLDLAKHVPDTVQLDGFDVSTAQFPHKEWIPSNVSLSALNAKTEPPEHLLEAYDIVHIRLFLAVVDNNDPTQILNHCLKLLKRGGYLQWDEYDPHDAEVISVSELVPKKALQSMTEIAKTTKPVKWVSSLPDTFQRHGLEVITVDRRHESRSQIRLFQEMHFVLSEEFATNFLDKKGPPGSGDKLRSQTQTAYEELQQGSCVTRLLQVVVGKKQ